MTGALGSSRRALLAALYRRSTSRGASYVEVLVIVAIVLLLGAAAMTALGQSSSSHATREAECIKTFSCNGGGKAGDISSLGGSAGPSRTESSSGKGVWQTTGDIAAGFFVDGLWGTVTGVGTAIAHPIDTVTSIGSAIAHPISTASAVRDNIATAWNQNPERFIGAGVFEVLTLPVAATKGAKVAKAAAIVEESAETARAGEKLAEVAGAVKRVDDAPAIGKEVAKHTEDLAKERLASSPIPIPETALIKEESKVGYDQIKYTWSEGGQKFEARWHSRTPGAPLDQGNTWVVTRTTPGTADGVRKTTEVLVGKDEWISQAQWQQAITARKNNTATPQQEAWLTNGHWPAP